MEHTWAKMEHIWSTGSEAKSSLKDSPLMPCCFFLELGSTSVPTLRFCFLMRRDNIHNRFPIQVAIPALAVFVISK